MQEEERYQTWISSQLNALKTQMAASRVAAVALADKLKWYEELHFELVKRQTTTQDQSLPVHRLRL